MAVTDKGTKNLPPDKLLKRIGKDITYISYSRSGKRLVFGKSGPHYYFRITSPSSILAKSTLPISPNQRAEEAFIIFQKEGFSSKLRNLYRWNSRNLSFDFEKKNSKLKTNNKNKHNQNKKALSQKQGMKPLARMALAKRDLNRLNNLQLKGSGSCFCIFSDRHFLTNYHVVKGADMVLIESDYFLSKAIVEDFSIEYDLAILRTVRKSGLKPLLISDLPPEIADYVFTIGYPDPSLQGRNVKFSEGSISALTGIHDSTAQQQISVPLQPGNSGGALVNELGYVVGVVQSTLNPFLRWLCKEEYLKV